MCLQVNVRKKLFATQIEQKIWNWYEFFFHHMCTQSQFGWKFSMYCSALYIAGVGGDAATNKVCIAHILHTKCLLFDKWLCRLREIAWKSIETLEDYTLKCVQFGLLIGWSLTYTHTPHTCHCDKPLLTQFSFIAIVIDEMKLSTIFAELSPLSMWSINQSLYSKANEECSLNEILYCENLIKISDVLWNCLVKQASVERYPTFSFSKWHVWYFLFCWFQNPKPN